MRNCDCEISQLVIELFTRVSWLLNTDCKSQECSREYFPRRAGSTKKKKYGGAGSRFRRTQQRAGNARRTSPSSLVPDRAIQPAGTSSAPSSPPSPPPPLPPRSTSLIQDVCGVINDPSPQPKKERKRDMISKLLATSDKEEKLKLIAKLDSMKQEELKSKPTQENLESKEKKLVSDKEMSNLSNLRSTAVKQGQAARHTLDSSQPNSQPDQLHQNVTQFLKQASEVKNKEAENKIKFEKMKSTPGHGFQKTQNIPFNNPFCFMCLKYVEKIHFCSSQKKYFNIDERNLFYIEGETPDQVSGTSDNPGKCLVFNTKREMKNQMIFQNSPKKLEFWPKVFDDLTNTELEDFNQDEYKYGMETAMVNARRIKAKSDPTFKEKLEKATLAKLAELPSLEAMNTYKEALEQGKSAYLVSISKSNEVTFQIEK